MAQKLRVFVGGNAYPLKGDNEKLIQLAAEEVNSQLEQLGRKHLGGFEYCRKAIKAPTTV